MHANRAELIYFFLAYVKGEHNSKVVAHIGDEDFTVRINTDGEEYNIEVCFTVESNIQTIISLSLWVFFFLVSHIDTSVAENRLSGGVCFGVIREEGEKCEINLTFASVEFY